MGGGFYQNKVNLSLTFTQRLGHKAHNCKMAYLQTKGFDSQIFLPSECAP